MSRYADRPAPLVSRAAARKGMEPPGPSDLVKIDGPTSSPSSGGGIEGQNPSEVGAMRGLT
jgi:hypothetical protein